MFTDSARLPVMILDWLRSDYNQCDMAVRAKWDKEIRDKELKDTDKEIDKEEGREESEKQEKKIELKSYKVDEG